MVVKQHAMIRAEEAFRGLEKNKTLVAWKFPNEDTIHWFQQDNDKIEKLDRKEVFNSSPGFLVSPFLTNEKVFNIPYPAILNEIGIEGIVNDEDEIAMPPLLISDDSQFEKKVNAAIKFLKKNPVDKIVLGRSFQFPLPAGNPISFFLRLVNLYEEAMVVYIKSDLLGTWMGASPELLAEIQDNTFSTISLAGTQKINGRSLEYINWKSKEIEEQQFVTQYIQQVLIEEGLISKVEGPFTAKAGTLSHLKTHLKATSSNNLDNNKLANILSKLHPTPAVCGTPQFDALTYINANEGLDRELYTGYWGPLGFNKKTTLYVNLRTMQLIDNIGLIYAGAGITAASNAKEEVKETRYKAEVIAKCL